MEKSAYDKVEIDGAGAMPGSEFDPNTTDDETDLDIEGDALENDVKDDIPEVEGDDVEVEQVIAEDDDPAVDVVDDDELVYFSTDEDGSNDGFEAERNYWMDVENNVVPPPTAEEERSWDTTLYLNHVANSVFARIIDGGSDEVPEAHGLTLDENWRVRMFVATKMVRSGNIEMFYDYTKKF